MMLAILQKACVLIPGPDKVWAVDGPDEICNGAGVGPSVPYQSITFGFVRLIVWNCLLQIGNQ